MLCPLCKIPLQAAERHGVEIDYCLQCRGVWLDRGELDKIIARAAQHYTNNAYRDSDFPQFDSTKGQQATPRYPDKNDKGYLVEIFDFDD
ncbi:MAG: zf-TFIIB domain-containing protein [Saprospiraceae bacterium]|nr:zf-TFIIB domain-containing protein [Saprospiraceae bacterium]